VNSQTHGQLEDFTPPKGIPGSETAASRLWERRWDNDSRSRRRYYINLKLGPGIEGAVMGDGMEVLTTAKSISRRSFPCHLLDNVHRGQRAGRKRHNLDRRARDAGQQAVSEQPCERQLQRACDARPMWRQKY
jgi:hypothetical protein